MRMRIFLLLAPLMISSQLRARNGHELWLPSTQNHTIVTVTGCPDDSVARTAQQELANHWQRGAAIRFINNPTLKDEQFIIRLNRDSKSNSLQASITASSGRGFLYGAYSLLRWQMLHKGSTVAKNGTKTTALLNWSDAPRYALRIVNHWDNLDGTIERGYAGRSILWNAPVSRQQWALRIRQYARANASIGINACVLNNVNASPKMLTETYIDSVRQIANILRPYGQRVYLSVNFASPMALGFTQTADPLDSTVVAWWRNKVKAIYKAIPDFGGFLVKANSEGQPGPFDYGRSHADGANMLADALRPFKGIVMWRSFVYGSAHKGEDRVKQAVSEFTHLDGQFRDNVVLQSKNGPLDFQPREPYAPIFDNIHRTRQMVEFQITQEYTGQARHLVFLAPMWHEFFGFVRPDVVEAMAGVANVGDSTNWCGHDFSQANWYAFGRMAWNPELTPQQIAREWVGLTFGNNPQLAKVMVPMMLSSREACVDYMMPLGLHHIFAFDHHYGPQPDGFIASYPLEWCPVYYHKADSAGIGFDRTKETGSGAVLQYRSPYREQFNNLATCPENMLLWFHHVPWTYPMKNGKTLWQNLVLHYNKGVNTVAGYRQQWHKLKGVVDDERWNRVDNLINVQLDNAKEWRKVCLDYFGGLQNNKNEK